MSNYLLHGVNNSHLHTSGGHQPGPSIHECGLPVTSAAQSQPNGLLLNNPNDPILSYLSAAKVNQMVDKFATQVSLAPSHVCPSLRLLEAFA